MVRTAGTRVATKPEQHQSKLLRFLKSNEFKADYAHAEASGRHRAALNEIWALLEILRQKKQIPPQYRCHPLKGPWAGWMDCHVEGDFILVWKYDTIDKEEVVVLAACGTHAYLF